MIHHPWKELEELRDSTHLKDDMQALRKVLNQEGYILIRGLLDREQVLKGRNVVIKSLSTDWDSVDTSQDRVLRDAHIKSKAKGILLTGFRTVTHHNDVLAYIEGAQLSGFMRALYGETPATLDTKWVRVKGENEFTDEHSDYYRFQTCAEKMCTCWIPLGDYEPSQGTIAVCEKSHLLEGYKESADGNCRQEFPDSYEKLRKTARWATSNFRAGDVLIFDIRLIHASTKNTTRRFRISMDSRWQPARLVPHSASGSFRAFQTKTASSN